MGKLTASDINELATFFASPLSSGYRSGVAAQSYEPKGRGYDPSTDTRLASLVFTGVRCGKSEWARMRRIVDELSDAHVEVLRLVCNGGRGAVACRTPRAIEAGRRLAIEAQREGVLERALDRAQRAGLSPMTCAMRVLEEDRRFVFVSDYLSTLRLVTYARDAIDEGMVDVEAETDALIGAAAAAYHDARARVPEWRRAVARREDGRRARLRAELADKQAAKERARFERRLRVAS